MFEKLVSGAESDNWGLGSAQSDYDRNFVAHRYAFIYLLTGDDHYARASRRCVEAIISNREWADPSVKGLMLYTAGTNVAYCYDHCFGAESWDKDFAEHV